LAFTTTLLCCCTLLLVLSLSALVERVAMRSTFDAAAVLATFLLVINDETGRRTRIERVMVASTVDCCAVVIGGTTADVALASIGAAVAVAVAVAAAAAAFEVADDADSVFWRLTRASI
jgi:putative Ca2+/H+ antiporter (TMEM165/GDT1 family)